MTTDVRAVTCGSSCCAVGVCWVWRLDEELLKSGCWRGAKSLLADAPGDDAVGVCIWPLVLLGASDGTGFSNRSFDGVLVGCGRGAFKCLGLACALVEGCNTGVGFDVDSSFNDSPFMYCDMSLAILC